MSAKRALYAIVIIVTLVLSACAKAGSSTTAAGSSTPVSQGPGLQLARQATAQAEATPTKIGVTVPLTSPPPKGKSVVFLQCEEDQCAFQGQGVSAAAKALGWAVHTLHFQAANPATLVSALNEALQYNPVGVFFAGEPYDDFSSVVPKYQKAGSLIVENFTAGAGIPANATNVIGVDGDKFSISEGDVLANYIIADSNANARVLFVTVPAYPTFIPFQSAFTTTLSQRCPSCKVTVLSATLSELFNNKLVPAIVSAIRTSPATNYIASVDGAFLTGLPSALSAAGIHGELIVSASASRIDEQNVKSGIERATIGQGLIYGGWQDIDVVLRHLEGMNIPVDDGGSATPLLTQQNVQVTDTGDYDVPPDYAQQFEALWGVTAS